MYSGVLRIEEFEVGVEVFGVSRIEGFEVDVDVEVGVKALSSPIESRSKSKFVVDKSRKSRFVEKSSS